MWNINTWENWNIEQENWNIEQINIIWLDNIEHIASLLVILSQQKNKTTECTYKWITLRCPFWSDITANDIIWYFNYINLNNNFENEEKYNKTLKKIEKILDDIKNIHPNLSEILKIWFFMDKITSLYSILETYESPERNDLIFPKGLWEQILEVFKSNGFKANFISHDLGDKLKPEVYGNTIIENFLFNISIWKIKRENYEEISEWISNYWVQATLRRKEQEEALKLAEKIKNS